MRRPKGGNGVVFRVLNQATKEVPIDSIQPHPRNVHEAPAAPLAESILENGFYGSIIVQQSTGYILVGKHRWKEAVAAGASKIPVTFIDVDDERGIKIMLADNRTGQLGADDPGQLASVLQDLGDLAGTGFSDGDLQVCRDLLEEKSAPLGYELKRWSGYHCGANNCMTHFAAVLQRSIERSSS